MLTYNVPSHEKKIETKSTQKRAMDNKLFMIQEEKRLTTEKGLEALSVDIFQKLFSNVVQDASLMRSHEYGKVGAKEMYNVIQFTF